MNSRIVFEVGTSYISIQTNLPVTFGILTDEFRVGKLLHSTEVKNQNLVALLRYKCVRNEKKIIVTISRFK